MKFYEICLGKITSVTNVDLNEDAYMLNLAIHTYLGICDSALHLGLWDHLCHFATQCIEVDQQNTSAQLHLVYRRRAQAYINQGRLEQAVQDLQQALDLANSSDIEKPEDKALIERDLEELKERMKQTERAKEGKKEDKQESEEEESKSEREFKDALDQLEDDVGSQGK